MRNTPSSISPLLQVPPGCNLSPLRYAVLRGRSGAVQMIFCNMPDGFWTAGHLNTTIKGDAGWNPDVSPHQHNNCLNMGFLDGHAELVVPITDANGRPNWYLPPVYAKDENEGLYYDADQLSNLRDGAEQW